MPKWNEKWKVPGSNGKTWTVSLATDNETWGCSCPVWKFRRQECHHIKLVKNGGGTAFTDSFVKPEYVLACVNKPIFEKEKNRLLVPLIAIPDGAMMGATICCYMLRYGYSMSEVREIRRIPAQWTAKAIYAHIEDHGEAEYPEGWYKH